MVVSHSKQDDFILNFAMAEKDARCFALAGISDFILISPRNKELASSINNKG